MAKRGRPKKQDCLVHTAVTLHKSTLDQLRKSPLGVSGEVRERLRHLVVDDPFTTAVAALHQLTLRQKRNLVRYASLIVQAEEELASQEFEHEQIEIKKAVAEHFLNEGGDHD